MDWEEKKELVVQSYEKTFDLNMAFKKVGLSETEVQTLAMDKDFQDRIDVILISEREDIIIRFKEFKDSDNDKIAFEATKDFAKVLYPDFFNGLATKEEKEIKEETNTKEEDDRIRKEYGSVLGGAKLPEVN